MNETEKLDLAEWAMNHTLKCGATEAAAELTSERRIDVEFREKKLDKLQESNRSRLFINVYVDRRYSARSTSDLRKDALERFISQAVAGAKHLAADEYRQLPDPKHYALSRDVDLGINDPAYDKVETPDRVRVAEEIEAAALAESDKIVSTTAYYADTRAERVRVHSNGFVGSIQGTRFEAGAEASVEDPGGGRPDDWSWAETRFRKDLPMPGTLALEAVDRALAKIGQKKIESGSYDCLVENRAVQRVLEMLWGPLSGGAIQQRTSFLEGMIGKQVGSEIFTMIDDPTVGKGLASRTFDGEGLAAKKMFVFERGILRNYYISNYYGRKLGMEPTSAGPSNIVFELGSKSPDDMVKDVKKGILVRSFIGGNSNSTTGDFSTGVDGFLIEDGRIVMPVNEMNISGNAGDILKHLVAVGNDPYMFGAFRTPSMLFEGVDFSGI